jgi:hypothetical protein
MLIFGLVGAGKSIFLTDLWAQIAHLFGYILVVEEGNSHGTTVQTAGASPIVVSPGGSTTINYFDPDGLPLTNEHLGSAVALCLQMLRENIGPNVDQARLSVLQGILTKHISLLYDSAWAEWSRLHPQEATAIEHRACAIDAYLKRMPGQGNTFLDAWASVRDDEGGLLEVMPDDEVARFATHHWGFGNNGTKSPVKPLVQPRKCRLRFGTGVSCNEVHVIFEIATSSAFCPALGAANRRVHTVCPERSGCKG